MKELRFGPVMVRVSPDTAVVILLVPAIFKISPLLKLVPVESSPTTVNKLFKLGPVIVRVSPDIAVVILDVPAILIVSPTLRSVPVLSSPTTRATTVLKSKEIVPVDVIGFEGDAVSPVPAVIDVTVPGPNPAIPLST